MDIQFIKEWANQNQGFLAIILFLLTIIIGWISGFFRWIINKCNKNKSLMGNKTFIQKSGKNSHNIQGENITINKYDNDK